MGKWEARVGEMVNTGEEHYSRLSAVAPIWYSKCQCELNACTYDQL